MSNNEHNAIAVRINKIQSYWIKLRKLKPNIRLFRWDFHKDDFVLVNGFLKLESSPHGRSDDTFVIFFNDFDSPVHFTHSLIKDWLNTFEKEVKQNPQWDWSDFEPLKEEFKTIDSRKYDKLNEFFIKLLVSFKKFEAKKDNLLVIGLIPRNVQNKSELNQWVYDIFQLLPNNIGMLLLDFIGNEVYDDVVSKLKNLTATIKLPDLNLKGAYKELATKGNPNDPQVIFRQCMLEMGEAVSDGDKKKLDLWGNKMLDITQSSGIRSFWASGHLIYAGFLFQFKESKTIHLLLDKGIKITQSEYKQKQDSAGVLLQLYSYKASYYSMCDENEKAIDWFTKQAETAKELEMNEQAVTAYLFALLIAEKSKDKVYNNIVKKAFETGYKLEDEKLKYLNFAFIAYHFINLEQELSDRVVQIEDRMASVFGKEWKKNAHKTNKILQTNKTPELNNL
jgi:hypothetical protein